jgi:hypothetical protein
MKCFPIFLLLIAVHFNAFAQNDAIKAVSGIIVKVETDSALAWVHVINKRTYQGDISDVSGHFMIFAQPGDTLQFSSIGFLDVQYVVDSIELIQVEMALDVTSLPEQIIYAIPKNLLALKQAMNNLVIRDSTDVFKENMAKAGFKAPPIHPVKPKVTPLNPISFFYDKVIEKIKERKIKTGALDEMPKLE